jgi:hypothetical protein
MNFLVGVYGDDLVRAAAAAVLKLHSAAAAAADAAAVIKLFGCWPSTSVHARALRE